MSGCDASAAQSSAASGRDETRMSAGGEGIVIGVGQVHFQC